MPAQELAFRRDRVVYWEFVRRDRYGEPLVKAPVELRVRWDDRQTLARDAQGNNVNLDAQVVAAREMVVGSIVLHQGLSYFVGTGSDGDVLDLYEVITNDRTPDIKNRASTYLMGLAAYKNDLPGIST